MEWKIVLPEAQIKSVMKWLHQVLGHAVENRLRDAVLMRYQYPDLRQHICNFVCDACQRHKLSGSVFGLLPGRDVNTHPWNEVAVDIIGPWSIEIRYKWYKFHALTIIDLITNLVELTRVDRKTSGKIRSKWEQSWLDMNPWPKRCIHDNGGQFTGWKFQAFLRAASIKDVPTTSRNPQSNEIYEIIHQIVEN